MFKPEVGQLVKRLSTENIYVIVKVGSSFTHIGFNCPQTIYWVVIKDFQGHTVGTHSDYLKLIRGNDASNQ
jgi:hypothetical protein